MIVTQQTVLFLVILTTCQQCDARPSNEATLIPGLDIPMHVMERILRENDISQINVIDISPAIMSEQNVETGVIKEKEKIIEKRFVPQLYLPRDLVFAILSDEAKRKALESIGHKSMDVKEKKDSKMTQYSQHSSTLNSVTFLLQSGFSEEHLNRLFSQVCSILRNHNHLFLII